MSTSSSFTSCVQCDGTHWQISQDFIDAFRKQKSPILAKVNFSCVECGNLQPEVMLPKEFVEMCVRHAVIAPMIRRREAEDKFCLEKL